jgi:molybdopterin-binding protein
MMNYAQVQQRQQIANLISNNGYKLIKGYVEDMDMGHITASMTIKSGSRFISIVIPVSEAKISGAETGRPIYCLMKGKDVFVFRDINYMMKKITDV